MSKIECQKLTVQNRMSKIELRMFQNQAKDLKRSNIENEHFIFRLNLEKRSISQTTADPRQIGIKR